MERPEELLDAVLNSEWELFRKVKSDHPVACQRRPEEFRKIRASIYAVWPPSLLASYLDDLRGYGEAGFNPFTYKYARMEGRLPPRLLSPLIAESVAVETVWQEEMKGRYPCLYNRIGRSTLQTGDGRSFSTYLKCELETYGEKTLRLYHTLLMEALDRDENLAITSLGVLLREQGYDSLEEAERRFSLPEPEGPRLA